MRKPIIVVTLGYPGSGKTHFSERLAKKDGFFHLSSDELRARMFVNPTYSIQEHQEVFAFCDFLAKRLLEKGVSVIYDANFNFSRHRARVRRLVTSRAALSVIAWIRTHEETALRRVKNRVRYTGRGKRFLHRPLDETLFRRLQHEIEHPKKSEPVVVIDGHVSFSVQYKQFAAQLSKILKTHT